MAKPIKKKFFEIEIPIINEKAEAKAFNIQELDKKTIKLDITRKLKGKNVDFVLEINVKDGKASAKPKKLTLLPYFIKHMLHGGISYVEDSFKTENQESEIVIKPFLITRKKVSRAVRKTLRNSAKNWIVDYLKNKNDEEMFSEVLSNQFQKALSIRLKKIYPLAICEIRVLEVKKQLSEKKEKIQVKEEIEEKSKDNKEN